MASDICKHLEGQNPWFGIIGRTYDNIGGDDSFEIWADSNPGKFYSMMMATAPSVQPVAAIQGNVILQVHPSLAPTSLDGEREINPDAPQ